MNELKKKAKVNELLDIIQTGLDLLGMIPVVGEPIDGINAGIYFVREDYANAALSAASTLPIAGWVSTGGKFVKKSIKVIAEYGDDALEGIKAVGKNADEVLEGIEIVGKNIDEVAETVGKTQIVVNHEIGSSFDKLHQKQ